MYCIVWLSHVLYTGNSNQTMYTHGQPYQKTEKKKKLDTTYLIIYVVCGSGLQANKQLY